MHIGPKAAKALHQYGGGTDAVGIIVAIDADALPALNRSMNPLGRLLHIRQVKRVKKRRAIRMQIGGHRFRFCNGPAHERSCNHS